MKNNLVFIGNSLKTMINFRGDIINSLSKLGYNCKVLAPMDTETKLDVGIEIIDIPLEGRNINPINLIRTMCIINRHCSNSNVFTYSILPIFVTSLALFFSEARHNSFFIGLGAVFLEKKYKLVKNLALYFIKLKRPSNIVALNESDRKLLSDSLNRDVLLMKGESLPEGFYFKTNSTSDDSVLFTVLRPFLDKGINEFADLVTYLRMNGVKNKVVLYGFDEKTCIDKLGVEFNQLFLKLGVKLEGYDPNFRNKINDKDLFVLTSPREGMSRTMMEMHSGRVAIVAFSVPGVRDLFDSDEKLHFLFEPGNTEAMASYILELLSNNGEYLDKLSDFQHDKATYFNKFKVLSFYRTLIEVSHD